MKTTLVRDRALLGAAAIEAVPTAVLRGRVTAIAGLVADVSGLDGRVSVGDCLSVIARDGRPNCYEIIGFRGEVARVMALDAPMGIGVGCVAELPVSFSAARSKTAQGYIAPNEQWLGRVIDPTGRPLDGCDPLPSGDTFRSLTARPPEATARNRLGPKLDLGVSVLDIFTPCLQGQRLGLFAGSGVGKSTLLAMIAKYASCDVIVLALVGERGREVRDFIEDEIGPSNLPRCVMVIATSESIPNLFSNVRAVSAG